MKKWLAGLVAVVLWMAGTTAMAEYLHENTMLELGERNHQYVQIGSALQHQTSYDLYEVVWCEDCHMLASRTYIDSYTKNENHSWNEENICYSCGQQNTCTHDGEREVRTEWRNYQYKSIGDPKVHEFSWDKYEVTWCKNCGVRISEAYLGVHTETRKHSWNEENVCYSCGQQNTCTHDGEREVRTEGRNYQYKSIGDPKVHEYSYDEYEVTRCKNCGVWISEAYLGVHTVTMNHSWNEENVCYSCGQQNTCTHDGERETWTEGRNYRYKSIGDPKVHEYSYDKYEVTQCKNCGVRISEAYLGVHTETGNHYWNEENVCYSCDQQNTCTHEKAVESISRETVSCTKIDEETHLRSFTWNIHRWCPTCNLESDGRSGGNYEFVERHRYYSSETCHDCGHVCTHLCVRDEAEIANVDYTDLEDGLNHRVVEELQYYSSCSACNRRVKEDTHTETKEYIERHDSKYHCRCGFKLECRHENGSYMKVSWMDKRSIALDEKQHTQYGRRKTYVYCSECGAELDVIESDKEEIVTTEAHTWNDVDICWGCGYANQCTHENTESILQRVDSGRYIAQNDVMHAQTVIYQEVPVCLDCSKVLSKISSLKKVTETKVHDFSGGYCWECGYQNSCKHDGATHTETENWWRDDPIVVDDKTHKMNADIVLLTYCDLCGECIEEERLESQWITEEHEMWGDFCERCDYKVDCIHENTVKKVLPGSDYLFCESISSNAHAETYVLYSLDYCEDCDILLVNRRDKVGLTTVNQPHNMASGRCVECGYCEHPEESIEIKRGETTEEYSVYNEYMHEERWVTDYSSVCQLCGESLSAWKETSAYYWNHRYSENNVCVDCAYDNRCLHEKAYLISPASESIGSENINDPLQHKIIRQKFAHMFCPDCKMVWDRQAVGEAVEEFQNHYYTTYGYCKGCKYKNPCEHKNTEIRKSEGEVYTEYIDENYHARYRNTWYESEVCKDCGQQLSREHIEGEPVLVGKEDHYFPYFNDRDVCSCGYVNPCKHEHMVVGQGSTGSYTRQCDDTHHRTSNILSKALFCADCGKEFSLIEGTEEYSTYDQHRYNGLGVCTICGYVNKCRHKETKLLRGYRYRSLEIIDDSCHEISRTVYEEEICLSCGESFGERIVENVIEQQKHNGEEYCTVCGWGRHVCEWEMSKERSLYSAKEIDALTHEAVVQYGIYWECAVCGRGRGGIPQEMQTVVEPHNFTDFGRCADCGYVNFCTHEETYEQDTPFRLTPYTQKDEHEHTYIADVTTETRCKTCDQRLSYTAALNVEYTEEHTFDNVADLICDLCGYEKEPPEEAPTPEPTPTATPEPTVTATPEPTNAPAPTKKPGGGNSGDGDSGTMPSKPKDTATPTPEELLPKTGDTSLPVGLLLLVMLASICGTVVLTKKKKHR